MTKKSIITKDKKYTPYGNLLISHKEADKLPKYDWRDGKIEVLERKLEISKAESKKLQIRLDGIKTCLRRDYV